MEVKIATKMLTDVVRNNSKNIVEMDRRLELTLLTGSNNVNGNIANGSVPVSKLPYLTSILA
jgi:hypothetical protein